MTERNQKCGRSHSSLEVLVDNCKLLQARKINNGDEKVNEISHNQLMEAPSRLLDIKISTLGTKQDSFSRGEQTIKKLN